jgi:hypothetical protein
MFPALSSGRWVGLLILISFFTSTVLSISLLASGDEGAAEGETLDGDFGPTAYLLAFGLGFVVGGIVAAVQWLNLRQHAVGRSYWILFHAGGTGLGLALLLTPMVSGFDQNLGQDLLYDMTVGAWGGVVFGLTLGIVSGWGLLRLKHRANPAAIFD